MSFCFFPFDRSFDFSAKLHKKNHYTLLYMQKSFYFWQKNRNRGKCWSKEEARMAFRRDAYKLLKTNIYLQFSDISRIFAQNI